MTRPLIPFQIGDYRMTVLVVGRFALDGGAMFGVVPKTLWNRVTPVDDQNRIPLGLNCLLIEYHEEKILLDTGMGTKFSEKYQAMYGVEPSPPLADILGQVGLQTTDITKVLFTHLHFDHAGGATKTLPDGSVVPTFENAQYYVHRGEWERAVQPHERSKASYLRENFIPLEEAGQLVLLDGDQTEIIPGLSLRLTGGHCLYHQILVLDRPEGGFVYWGDLIPTRHHVKIPYVMGYDEYPLETMEMKKKLLQEAVSKEWLSVFEHEVEYPVCQLKATEKPDTYEPIPFIPAMAG